MKNKFIIIVLIILVAVSAYFFLNSNTEVIVTNFEECITAGNPAMESYPRQCIHDNITYVENINTNQNEDIVTSADNAPPGSIHNLPVPYAVSAVRAKVATDLGISEGIVIVMTAYEKTWTNGCLDLAEEGEMCTEALVQGYEVTVQAQGREYIYHTNADGKILRENK